MSPDPKLQARERARRKRDEAHETLRLEAPSRIADHFLAAIPHSPSQCVAGYAAIGSEADPEMLLARLADAEHQIALPAVAVRNAPLVFRRWRPGDPLTGGSHGTREPLSDEPECRPDILLVPLLAFDAAGRRLGYGGGYYDRTLAALRTGPRPVLAVGVAFSAQEAQDLPEDEFDQRLDWVVTEKGARPFDGASGR